jgi:hypothetical protein
MVLFRVDNACLLGGILVSLSGIGDQPALMQAEDSQRFCIYEFWWVQGIPDAH